jgi:hypothetical protein
MWLDKCDDSFLESVYVFGTSVYSILYKLILDLSIKNKMLDRNIFWEFVLRDY